MAIIPIPDWVPPDTATFDTVQKLKQNPDGPYRELLMAEDADGNPVPYKVPTGGEAALIRVPHGLSTPGNPRIPDVVVPVPVADLAAEAFGVGLPLLAWAPGVVPDGSKTGMWADDEYIYLLVLGFGFDQADFVVYIEYTHSIIRNEIITGEYYEFPI